MEVIMRRICKLFSLAMGLILAATLIWAGPPQAADVRIVPAIGGTNSREGLVAWAKQSGGRYRNCVVTYLVSNQGNNVCTYGIVWLFYNAKTNQLESSDDGWQYFNDRKWGTHTAGGNGG